MWSIKAFEVQVVSGNFWLFMDLYMYMIGLLVSRAVTIHSTIRFISTVCKPEILFKTENCQNCCHSCIYHFIFTYSWTKFDRTGTCLELQIINLLYTSHAYDKPFAMLQLTNQLVCMISLEYRQFTEPERQFFSGC